MHVLNNIISFLFTCLLVLLMIGKDAASCRLLCDSQSFLPCLFLALLVLTHKAPQLLDILNLQMYRLQLVTPDAAKIWLLTLSCSLSLSKNEKYIQTLIRPYTIQSWDRWVSFWTPCMSPLAVPPVRREEVVMNMLGKVL